MFKHKWRLDGKEWRCGWCQARLPNTPAGRSVALHGGPECDRKTPEQRRAEDAAADAVNAELAVYRAAQRLGEPLPVLSEAAAVELHRRSLDWRGRRALRLNTLAAMAVLGGGVKC